MMMIIHEVLLYLTCLTHTMQLGQEINVPKTLEHLSPDDENQEKDLIQTLADKLMNSTQHAPGM